MGGELFLCIIYFYICGWCIEISLIKIFVCFDFFKSWNNYCDGFYILLENNEFFIYECKIVIYLVCWVLSILVLVL